MLTTNDSDAAHGRIATTARGLLRVLHDTGVLSYRESSLPPARFADCMTDFGERDSTGSACLQRALPRKDEGRPLVTVALSFTRSRAASQKLVCIGPATQGQPHEHRLYMQDVFHGREDVRRGNRDILMNCLEEALGK